jgi:hypothetical protein
MSETAIKMTLVPSSAFQVSKLRTATWWQLGLLDYRNCFMDVFCRLLTLLMSFQRFYNFGLVSSYLLRIVMPLLKINFSLDFLSGYVRSSISGL